MRTPKIPKSTQSASTEKPPKKEAKKRARKARPAKAAPQKTTSTNPSEIVEAALASESSVASLGVHPGCTIETGESIAESRREPVEGVSGESGPGDGPSPVAPSGARCWFCGHPATGTRLEGDLRAHIKLPVCALHAPLKRRGRQVSFDGRRWSSDLHALEAGMGRPGPWD
jgi:hypothetical protein